MEVVVFFFFLGGGGVGGCGILRCSVLFWL